MTTTDQNLCVPATCGRIEYTVSDCGDGKVLYTQIRALDRRPGLSAAACTWNRATYQGATAHYFGTCGRAPAVDGGDQLPTVCVAA